MVRYNSDVENIKHSVLTEIARLYFEDLGEDYYQEIPYIIIPGMTPRYRCCVFKEREILRRRLQLARGKALAGGEKPEIINVIKEACHGCPINRYQVTQNCQKCLAKSCVKECRFGAISIGAAGAYIDQTKCKECGKCVSSCPYNAITDTQRPCVKGCPTDAIGYDKDKLAVIDRDKCIVCGNCIKSCPFGAVSESSDICGVISRLKNKDRVIALLAPSVEGQFGQVNMGGIMNAVKELGFYAVAEVSAGADAVAKAEAAEAGERAEEGKKTLTSCCPAFFNLIDMHFPALSAYVSSTVSPMIAAARLARKEYENAVVVFVGPCIAKKHEAKKDIEGNVDYVLTFEELGAMFDAKNIKLENSATEYQSSRYGREFAASGGVAAAVAKAADEAGGKKAACHIANGARECRNALNILKAGKLDADIIEGMACEGGCVAGPATIVSPQNCRKNKILIQNAQGRPSAQENDSITKGVQVNGADEISLKR